ncbi:MAG: DUF3793 family protein [Oscillospiraceae bacterium]|nr:DUF3793 family protein [Oscillospiraceae bacterium]
MCNDFICNEVKLNDVKFNDEKCRFGKLLAFHTAPTLLGIKCASLISLAEDEYEIERQADIFNSRAAVKGLRSRILCSCGSRRLMLIYNEKQLAKRLGDERAKALLVSCGYPEEGGVDEYLDTLAERIRQGGDFPHEIGVFLGYPMEDVEGFIENRGGNFKLCGCWKVYGCEESARRIFANYEKCRRFLCGKLDEGADIYQALKIS